MTGAEGAAPGRSAGCDGGVPRHRVAIVGAGFAGIGTAIALLRRGIRDIVVFERAGEVGGTWRDNTYPGAACDVPSNLYSYSFAPNPDWSHSFSPQSEIEAYLRRCAAQGGVLDHVRFHHEVTSARWVEDDSCWEIATTAGTHRADVLVSARGPLSEPSLPEIPGLSAFAGTLFHSARWDHAHDLAGERVGVLGTGASAVQFVPEIQPRVRRLHVFQRTAPWVLPRRDRALHGVEHAAFRACPPLQLAARAAVYWGREAYVAGFVGPPRSRRLRAAPAVAMARRHLARQVRDPDLRAALTPGYELGCKRVLLSNDWYPALTRPNVEVVTSAVAEVRPRSVLLADGTERELDTLILGTGFDVTGHAAASSTVGRDGRTLAEAFGPRLAAYKAMTVPGFPNLFFMVGPNSGLGHSSIVFVIESQIRYLLGALGTMERLGARSLEVRPEALERWLEGIERRSAQTVWTAGGCASYYLDPDGRNVALWPGTSWSYRRATRRFDVEAYDVRTTAAPGGPRRLHAAPAVPGPAELAVR